MKNAATMKNAGNAQQASILYGFSLLLIAIGLALCPSPSNLLEGIRKTLLHPSLIDFDSFFWSGELGVPFVQAGVCLAAVLLVYRAARADISGPQIACALMVAGFSFYGKNMLNIWFPMAGVFLYARVKRKSAAEVSTLAALSTCLGPVFSTLAFYTEPLGIGSAAAVTAGVAAAVLAGFLTGLFADYFPRLHQNMTIFNVGMAAGWVAILFNGAMKAFGLGHDVYPYAELSAFTTDQNALLAALLGMLFAYLAVWGTAHGGLRPGVRLLMSPGNAENRVETFGLPATLFAMGAMGILATLYVLLIGGSLNGVSLAAIISVAAFAACGSSLRAQAPALLGAFIGGFLSGGVSGVMAGGAFFASAMEKVATRGLIFSVLLTCGFAPISGTYGALAAALAGFVNVFVSSSIAPLHGHMLLYSSGFSIALTATLNFPLYTLARRRAKTPLARRAQGQFMHAWWGERR